MNNSNWNENKEQNILEDIENAINIIKNQKPRKISFMEALYHDRDMLGLAGYSKEQIKYYEELVMKYMIERMKLNFYLL